MTETRHLQVDDAGDFLLSQNRSRFAVQDGSARFVLDGDADAVRDNLAAALGPALVLAEHGRIRRLRRTWLDTFDWRLRRAGLTLEQVGTGRAAHLVLTGPHGERLASGPAPGTGPAAWPSLAVSLPDAPLREQVEPVAGVRALAPVVKAVSQVHELRVLNTDAKTIARLSVNQMSVSFPAAARLAPSITVSAVRGYQAKVRQITMALRGCRCRRSHTSDLDAALAATGSLPEDQAPAAAGLRPGMPAANAVAAILTGLLTAMTRNVPGAIRDVDTEFLHDLRVAVRRTRAVIKLAGDALPEGMAARFAPEFRWLGDLTTPTRDLDVYLLDYPALRDSLQAAAADELEPFHGYLRRARAAARQDLVRGLRSARFARLVANWRTALGEAAASGQGRGGRPPAAAALAACKIDLARRRALRTGRRLDRRSTAPELHRLRKRCKELRYLIEVFGPLYDPAQRTQAVRELKALQDCLGEFQDAQVQHDELRGFASALLAERSAPAGTLLALGEIAAGLAARQRHARARFERVFADFASTASQDRLVALTQGPLPAGGPPWDRTTAPGVPGRVRPTPAPAA